MKFTRMVKTKPIQKTYHNSFIRKGILVKTFAVLLVTGFLSVSCTDNEELVAPTPATPEAASTQPAETTASDSEKPIEEPKTQPAVETSEPGKESEPPKPKTEADMKPPTNKIAHSWSMMSGLPQGKLTRSWQINDETHLEVIVTNDTDKVFTEYITVVCVTRDKSGKKLSTTEENLLAQEEGQFTIGYTGAVEIILPDKSTDIGAVKCSVTAAE